MKKIASGLIIVLVIGFSYGLHLYYKPATECIDVDPDFFFKAKDLKELLTQNHTLESKYINSVILVEGEISSMEEGSVFIESSVRCELAESLHLPQKKGLVKIKGLFAGYDELFEEVLLVKCKIEEKE